MRLAYKQAHDSFEYQAIEFTIAVAIELLFDKALK